MGFPAFPLLLLIYMYIFFVFNFGQFDHYGMFLLGFILPGTLLDSWTWVTLSFPTLGMFSAIISSNIFSGPFSLSSPWDPCNANVGMFVVVPKVC